MKALSSFLRISFIYIFSALLDVKFCCKFTRTARKQQGHWYLFGNL